MDTDSNSDELLFDMLLGIENENQRRTAPDDAPASTPAPVSSTFAEDPQEKLFSAMLGMDTQDKAQLSLTNSLSKLQERLWLVQQLNPESTAYIMPYHVALRGCLNTAAIKEAIQSIWRRHESLRTIFPSINGLPSRVVLPPDDLTIREFDFNTPELRDTWQNHYFANELKEFRLDKGPLMQACLYRLAAEEHMLLLDFHHINNDGVSLDILRRELFGFYNALLEGKSPVLPPPGASYAEFVAEETAERLRPDYKQELEKCAATLSGAPTRLNFSFDKPIPATFSYHGAYLDRAEKDALYSRVIESGRKLGLSPFMMFLSGFGSMLHLHTGQEDLLIGIPVSLRKDGRFENTVGFFVNTCVARLDFRGNPTLQEIMKRTSKAVREMLHVPDMPLDYLVNALRDKRSTDRPPLIQTTISYLAVESSNSIEAIGLSIEQLALRRSCMFELAMDVIIQKEGSLFGLEYSSDAWEEGSIRRMFDHFHLVMEALADYPDMPIGDINLMPAPALKELEPVLHGRALDASGRCVPDRIEEIALGNPARTAVICGGVETSFDQLRKTVALRRAQLRALGLKPGAVLALASDPGLEWLATALAALSENIVVLPLDPAMPKERLLFILKDSGAGLLRHDDSLSPISLAGITSCRLHHSSQAAEHAPVNEPSRARPDSTAYIIYTSGSTGQPKGVRVSHGAFETHCRSAILAYGLGHSDRSLVFAPAFFDASWEQLFAPLLAGASVVIRDAQLWAPAEICQRIAQFRITCVDIPPQYLRELLFFWKGNADCVPTCLRLVIAGGESMPSALAQAWLDGPLSGVPLINAYGPTEAVVTSTFNRISNSSRIQTANGVVPIGRAMPGRTLHILTAQGLEVGAGIAGELCLEGPCLAEGYQGDQERTDQAFRYWLRTPAGGRWVGKETPGAVRLYRTGDRVRIGPDDCIEFLGRSDSQIKIRGFRIEPGEIEAVLTRHPAVAQSLVTTFDDPIAGKQLAAYFVPSGKDTPSHRELTDWLSQRLPEHMIPVSTVPVSAFTTTASGKIDISALPRPTIRRENDSMAEAPANELEKKILAIWCEILGRTDVGLNDNFFDLGGHSILLVRVHTRLLSDLGATIPLVDLFSNPTVSRLAKKLRGENAANAERTKRVRSGDIAVIGMSGRFPGANTVEELWTKIAAGQECIRFFTPAELDAEGVSQTLYSQPDYVPAHGHMEGTRLFDAGFFGYTPKEAEIIDPQQRVFLEEAWHALENAAYDPDRYRGDIGVFGGMGMSIYLLNNLSSRLKNGHGADAYAISLANDKDFITTRVSYKMNLRGPSVNINTACSTSLVAIHMASEALLHGECDLALAGGVTLHLPPMSGYVYQPGSIASPDGHCRAFAEDACGTVGGSGAAVVVLKRLDQALADGDTIHAVIKGSAVNNDGSDKVGFTAPGVGRQRDVIRAALDNAGLSARGVQYIEAHGTATPMGDPIEVQALTDAFGPDKPEAQSCYIGSIKSNIGHLDTAAGVAGFIKAVCALEHGLIPPTLHCEHPSSKIGFENTPFRVAQKLISWPGTDRRRAGVSSFGMGGTNAHIVLEQAPEVSSSTPTKQGVWCIPLSARSTKSLLTFARNLALHLETHPQMDPQALWFTLAEGRRRFPLRAVILAASRSGAVASLRSLAETDILRTDRDGKKLSGTGNPQSSMPQNHPEFVDARAFSEAWLAGETSPLSDRLPHRRIPLPTYVFDHEQYWVEARPDDSVDVPEKQTDEPAKLPLEEWFYFPSWERLPALRDSGQPSDAPLLIIHHGSLAEARWLDALRSSDLKFTACQGGAGIGNALLELTRHKVLPPTCWHIAALGQDAAGPIEFARRLDALLGDLRTLATSRKNQPLSLTLLVPHSGNPESPEDPAYAYLNAACIVIPHEYAGISSKLLRLDPTQVDAAALNIARAATSQEDGHRVYALSAGRLWRQIHSRLPLGSQNAGQSRLKERGVYLISGGLGGIGLTLARHLASSCKARLILVSRHAPSPSQRELISALESDGAELRTAALDMADANALRSLVDDVSSKWGRIDGVIHAAGVGGGSLMARTQLEEINRVLSAKVAGTLSLAAALRGREPSFVILCSSLTASLGGPGQVAYAAANAWMDAFAAKRSAEGNGIWTSVQWDSWAEVGMAARATGSAGKPSDSAHSLLREWTLTPSSYWPWGEHRIGGTAVLPGTAYLELFAQALGTKDALELHAVALNEPMMHEGEASRLVSVFRQGDQLILQSDDGRQVREHARARIAQLGQTPSLQSLAEIEARCSAPVESDNPSADAGIIIEAGPRWNIEGRYLNGSNEALAEFVMPSLFVGDLAEHSLHPALLDIALSFYTHFIEGGIEVLPWRYEKLRVYAPLVARVLSHARLRSQNPRAIVMDVDVRDPSGRLLVQVEGYTLLRVDSKNAAAPGHRETASLSNPFAMTPVEGVEAFLRTLTAAEPIVCISTVDWKFAKRQVQILKDPGKPDTETSQSDSKRMPRPETGLAYVEARTEAEKLMAGIWAEVLGYDRIGIDDDLFDLGADSLSALQASARVKELTGHELSMERFFAKATVANLAEDMPDKATLAAEAPGTGSGAWEEGEL